MAERKLKKRQLLSVDFVRMWQYPHILPGFQVCLRCSATQVLHSRYYYSCFSNIQEHLGCDICSGLEKLVGRGAEKSTGHRRNFPQLGDLWTIPRDFRLHNFVCCRVPSAEQVTLWPGMGGAWECGFSEHWLPAPLPAPLPACPCLLNPRASQRSSCKLPLIFFFLIFLSAGFKLQDSLINQLSFLPWLWADLLTYNWCVRSHTLKSVCKMLWYAVLFDMCTCEATTAIRTLNMHIT